MKAKRVRRGFSLVEIMVSIALFILLVGLIVANSSFLNRYMVRAQLDNMYNVFRYLQKSAVVSGKETVLKFDIPNNTYMFDGRVCTLPRCVTFGVLPEVKGPPCLSKKVLSSSITFKGKKVIFTKDGMVTSGTVYITDVGKNFMYAISSGVAQVSYLRKYTYNGKWVPVK